MFTQSGKKNVEGLLVIPICCFGKVRHYVLLFNSNVLMFVSFMKPPWPCVFFRHFADTSPPSGKMLYLMVFYVVVNLCLSGKFLSQLTVNYYVMKEYPALLPI